MEQPCAISRYGRPERNGAFRQLEIESIDIHNNRAFETQDRPALLWEMAGIM